MADLAVFLESTQVFFLTKQPTMKTNFLLTASIANDRKWICRWKWPLVILLTLVMVATSILVRYSFFPPLAAADASTGQEVLQGEIPALGTVTLMFHPSSSIDGSSFGVNGG